MMIGLVLTVKAVNEVSTFQHLLMKCVCCGCSCGYRLRQADALISGFHDFLPPDICNYSLLNKTENTYKNALDKTEN